MYHHPKVSDDGERYAGMRVGGEHVWRYTGEWRETKRAPDRWGIRFEAVKRRRVAAPEGSGAPDGATFDWLIIARQTARKADANAYQTLLEGLKWKVGSRFPSDAAFSYERRGLDQTEVVRAYLEETLDLLRARKAEGLASRALVPEP